MNRKRVVVLARAGAARERTEAAIVQAGADVAALLDPATASEDDVRAAAPDVLLVILDPFVEQALDTFDDVLGDPALEILFDDADVAAKRDAWETARWARHLQAKLHGHDDVLPPVRDAAAAPVAASDEPLGFQAEMEALSLQVAAMPDVPQSRSPVSSTASGAVVIAAGTLGNSGDLIVSQHHRMFLYQRERKPGLATSELLVQAKHLVDNKNIFIREGGFVDFFSLVFDRHEIIYAEGVPAESLMVNDATVNRLPSELSEDVKARFPGLSQNQHFGTEAGRQFLDAIGPETLFKAPAKPVLDRQR